MNKINILDSTIYNRIAAGEVVERPYSVIKELLDNSLDAKATEIEIKIYEGGIKHIEVADNGVGIEFDDLERAFMPHATSKISCVEDLDKIGTLGFRGEALASICSVSEVTLVSKTKNAEFGGKIECNGGNLSSKEQVGVKDGTTVSVSNIFFNVPARAKFLKKPKQEVSEITNLVLRYILAHPTVKFKFYNDDNLIYSSTGNGLYEAIYCVYGKTTCDNILKVDFISDSNIRVHGYIGMPTFSKPNRTYQTLIVNSRYVQNAMVSLCVYNAFEHYLMKGQFPFFVLNIDLPLDSLDVNVHPNKMDIRFENSNQIYGVVYQAVMQALNEHSNKVIEINKTYNYTPSQTSGVSFSSTSPDTGEQKVEKVDIVSTQEVAPKNTQTNVQTSINFYESLAKSGDNHSMKQSNAIFSNIFEKSLAQNEVCETKQCEDDLFKSSQVEIQSQVIEQSQTSFLGENPYTYIGTLFETFLIVQSGENAFIIDQHAAHERLLFDKFSKQVNDQVLTSQMLLVPYTFSVNSLEKQFIDENIDNLLKMGFEISEFGNLTYKVSTIPSLLSGMNLNQFFSDILADLSVFKQLKSSDLVLSKLMQHSCKTAVKAGDKLTSGEVEYLISQIDQTNMQLQCPHGRPVVIKLTHKEIEKWFKRIV